MNFYKVSCILFFLAFGIINSFGQISPGELSSVHSHLEGISNCTQCHLLGEKLSNEKCLSCHTELKYRIFQSKGYHSSIEVKGKECSTCHSDHHGLNFKIVKFEENNFNHNIVGYILTGAHLKRKCKDCHTLKNISDIKIKNKKFTFLGLKTVCVSCHTDYHKNTLSASCINCHNTNTFKPATLFNHANTKFKLEGKHKNVACIKCHKIEIVNGVKFQKYSGIEYKSCTNCHTDIHQNKFGKNCLQCHTNESFRISNGLSNFDHTKTKYKLEEKHLIVNCKLCHKNKLTTPLKFQKCTDCHQDYHKKQFVKDGLISDCLSCHTLSGFATSTYTIEQHNKINFVLLGSHIATPCIDCHKKENKWTFRNIGKRCNDCHTDIHKGLINIKYYPDSNCLSCHSNNKWNEISFDHAKTNFKLTGSHVNPTCKKCHFSQAVDGSKIQRFANKSVNCVSCHVDIHYKQFDKDGATDCIRCHDVEKWKTLKFNHNNTAFKLDGKHTNVPCVKCHKLSTENQNKYIKYKIFIKCESCHL